MNINALLSALATLAETSAPAEDTEFAKLSDEAQDLIVRAAVGEFEDGPPEIPDRIKEEIRQWAAKREDEE